MISSETILNTRVSVFGMTGIVCVGYAVLALAVGQPDPIPFWIPGAFGVMAAIVLTLSSFAAGHRQAEMAWDEGYHSEARRAAAIAFWVGIALNPIVTLLILQGSADSAVGLAVLGTFTPGVYLLLIVWFDLRGRA